MNCCLELNYTHTPVSSQRDFDAHPKESLSMPLPVYVSLALFTRHSFLLCPPSLYFLVLSLPSIANLSVTSSFSHPSYIYTLFSFPMSTCLSFPPSSPRSSTSFPSTSPSIFIVSGKIPLGETSAD